MDFEPTIVEKSIVVLLVAINFIITYIYFRLITPGTKWILPSSIFVLYYNISYPLKTLYIINPIFEIHTFHYFTCSDLILALLYSTVFFTCFISIFLFLIRKYAFNLPNGINIMRGSANLKVAVYIFTILYFIGFYTKYSILSYYGFLEIEVSRTVFENMIINLSTIWPAVLLLSLVYKNKYPLRFGCLSVIVISFVVLEILLSTHKAIIIIFAITYLIYCNINYKEVSIPFMFLLGIVAVVIFIYSYAARFSAITYYRMDISSVVITLSSLVETFYQFQDRILGSFFDRFEIVDNLIYTMQRVNYLDLGYYKFGSLAEIFNLIPSIFWPERPEINLNIFVNREILGTGFEKVTSSIGRIGESYLIFGCAGVTFGFLYGLLFFLAYYYLFYNPKNSLYTFIYLYLFFSYFIFDDYFFQSLFTICFVSISIIVVFLIVQISMSLKSNNYTLTVE